LSPYSHAPTWITPTSKTPILQSTPKSVPTPSHLLDPPRTHPRNSTQPLIEAFRGNTHNFFPHLFIFDCTSPSPPRPSQNPVHSPLGKYSYPSSIPL
ncbi:hypothetical protein E1A91_D03G059200v1, partial [Gossypium mustelinum]